MRRHWQKKPLLVRQAWPGVQPPLPRAALFELAARDDVESRLVACQRRAAGGAPRARCRGARCHRCQGPLDAAGAGRRPAPAGRARLLAAFASCPMRGSTT
jgi:hypothetical protein